MDHITDCPLCPSEWVAARSRASGRRSQPSAGDWSRYRRQWWWRWKGINVNFPRLTFDLTSITSADKIRQSPLIFNQLTLIRCTTVYDKSQLSRQLNSIKCTSQKLSHSEKRHSFSSLSSPCCWRNFELLCSELEHGCEGGVVWDLQHLERQLGVGGECDLEGDLRASCRHN